MKREVIAAVLLMLGLLLMAGSVGSAEFYERYFTTEDWIRVGVGLAMCGAALPIGGIERANEDNDNEQM